MAAPVVAFVGTKAVDAESTTGWNTGSLDNDIFVEGAGSVGAKTSNSLGRFYDLSVAGGPYNFSSGGGNEGEHIWAWMASLTPTDSHRIVIADDLATDSIGEWDVGPAVGYALGFANYVINPAADFSRIVQAGTGAWTTTGNPAQLSGIDGFGGVLNQTTTIMGNFNNALVDAISVGLGYRITLGDAGSTEGVFNDFASFEQTTANRFGALNSTAGVLFPLCRLFIGADTGSTNTEFIDSGFSVVWPDANVAADFYALVFEQATGLTDVTLSTGSLQSEADPVLLDFAGINSVTITNVNANTQNGPVLLDGNVSWDGGQLTQCGYIDLGGQPTLTNLTILNPEGISPVSSDAAAMIVNAANEMANVSDITFDGAGIGGTAQDAAIEIDISAAGPHTIGFTDISFVNRVAGSVDLHFLDQGADRTYDINVTGGTSPTFTKDRAGDTVNIVLTANYNLAGMNSGTEITILDRSVSMIDFGSTGSAFAFGNATATERAGQSFTVNGSGKAERVKLWLRKVGTPTDGLTVRLVNGVPGSTLLAESLPIPGSILTTSFVEYDIDLTEKNLTSFPTVYGIEIQRTGAIDSGNYYEIQYDTSDVHNPGDRYVYNSGWGTATGDLFLEVMEAASDNELFHVESSGTSETWQHDGTNRDIEVLALHQDYLPILLLDSVSTQDKDATLTQSPDRVFSNP